MGAGLKNATKNSGGHSYGSWVTAAAQLGVHRACDVSRVGFYGC